MIIQPRLVVVEVCPSQQVTTSTGLVTAPPLAVVPLQEVQGCGIHQLGITQYLEIEI